MKYIITESKLQEISLGWMNKHFSPDKLEVIEDYNYPDSIFYRKDGIVVMERNSDNKYFSFDYLYIWSFFESFFGLNYVEIKFLMKIWLEETFNLKGYDTTYDFLERRFRLE